MLKFGNPVIFERMIGAPTSFWEYVFQPWPVRWGYFLVGLVVILTLKAGDFRSVSPRWILFLPLAWFFWQLLSSTQSVNPQLSQMTVWHFGATVTWFYVGVFGLGRQKSLRLFWILLLPAFVAVLWFGSEQHYGGLEATRRIVYEEANWRDLPPTYLKKIASDRIFSTLVYPNAFAGVLLLFFPFMVPVTWKVTAAFPRIARLVCTGFLIYLSLACLLWTGSKAGWLIALIVTLAALSSVPAPGRIKVAVFAAVLAIGLSAFFIRYAPYFQKGATSVVARFDYWEAAMKTALDRPVFGSGPGTFSIPYSKLKHPDAEMARLAHNDYLEQASDSGILGFVLYGTFVLASMTVLYRKVRRHSDGILFPVWLGLAGWSIQGLVEFSLYIPALAWPAFAFLGLLFSRCAPDHTPMMESPQFANPVDPLKSE